MFFNGWSFLDSDVDGGRFGITRTRRIFGSFVPTKYLYIWASMAVPIRYITAIREFHDTSHLFTASCEQKDRSFKSFHYLLGSFEFKHQTPPLYAIFYKPLSSLGIY